MRRKNRLHYGDWLRATMSFIVASIALTGTVQAYPQFQLFSQQHSGRPVDCAMCHINRDGPDGTRFGQIGSLTTAEMDTLTTSRNIVRPGKYVDSPILNSFGNHIVESLGGEQIRELAKDPSKLAQALGPKGDLDGDGISDSQEYLDGTDPLSPASGAPWRLIAHNARKYRFHLVMITLATALGIYGLNRLMRWFHAVAEYVPVEDPQQK